MAPQLAERVLSDGTSVTGDPDRQSAHSVDSFKQATDVNLWKSTADVHDAGGQKVATLQITFNNRQQMFTVEQWPVAQVGPGTLDP